MALTAKLYDLADRFDLDLDDLSYLRDRLDPSEHPIQARRMQGFVRALLTRLEQTPKCDEGHCAEHARAAGDVRALLEELLR